MQAKPVFLAISGTMGSGKTTVAQLISQRLGYTLFEEKFDESPFLASFYEDPKRWAFHSQVFFLMQKVKQYQAIATLLTKATPPKGIVLDSSLEQYVYSYGLAQVELGHMSAAEWDLYLSIFQSLALNVPKPDVIVSLQVPFDVIKNRIAARARDYEQKIDDTYLAKLDELNKKWIQKSEISVIDVDADTLNFVDRENDKEVLVDLVKKHISAFV